MPDDLDALLNAYLDGRLSAAQAARLDARRKKPAVEKRLKSLQALRGELRAALPRPSPEQSRRLWAAVRARCVVAPLAQKEGSVQVADVSGSGWFAWLGRPWVPAWGLGLGAAAAALALVFLLYPRWSALRQGSSLAPVPVSVLPAPSKAATHPTEHADAAILALAAEEAPRRIQRRNALARARHAEALASAAPKEAPKTSGVQPAAAVAPAAVLAGLPVQAPAALGPGATEVERALADNQADALVSRFLSMQPEPQVPVVAMFGPSEQAAAPGAEDAVAYQPESEPRLQAVDSGVPGPVQGGKDGSGYWDWVPAAQAMNQRDWAQARVELLAAADKAGSSAERDFAHSALNLLASSGGPLEGTQSMLPSTDDLRVLGAGTWQLLVDSRLARFGKGVALRLPGLRVDGDSFLLDLGFNRGQFSPGSHFVRVSGENPAKVLDASGQPMTDNDFYAPSGADYDLKDKVLRLR